MSLDTLGAEIKDRLAALAERLSAGEIGVSVFREQMARHLIVGQAGAYMLGVDSATLSLADQRVITDANKRQLAFLDGFVAEIADGVYDDRAAGLTARAQLYAGSVRETFERGKTKGADLPAYPGDGSTACHGNCLCQWEEHEDGWYWVLGLPESEHCTDCPDRADQWAPYSGGEE